MVAAQDMPPAGGFPETIRYQRYIPRRGPSGALLLTAAFAAMAYGWTEVKKGNTERRFNILIA
jgi:NADH dehydrogenase (ubiquinone) 1 alpha subcomplex subunit 13